MGHAGLKASDDEQTGSPRTLGEQLLKGLTEFRGNRTKVTKRCWCCSAKESLFLLWHKTRERVATTYS
jgi:hypothetical protein